MADPKWQNLVQMFFEQTDRLGKRPFLWAKLDGKYRPLSWYETREKVARLAAVLAAKGVGAGDRVLILSENRPEWCISDLAIMALGAITVPAYTTNTTADHRYILENSGAKGAVVSSRSLAARFLPAAHSLDSLRFAIAIEDPGISQSLNVEIERWAKALEDVDADLPSMRQAAMAVERTQTACLIYTSGTGGAPKGVMIPHGAILHNCEGAEDVLSELPGGRERFLSFLPLSHAYEHTGGQFLPMYLGAEIYYAESLEKLGANFVEARPTIMTVVPRLFEMLQSRITLAVEKEGGMKAKLFARALELGRRKLLDATSLSFAERCENVALDILVRRKAQARFGGKVKALISGGAPLNPEVGFFFAALGLRLLQGYGQTESGPVASVNRPSDIHMDTVGPPMKGVEVKIAEDGEILLRGELVMNGYWRNEEETAAVLKDGWLHTGDIGYLDERSHLLITDRKKDILINDKGDNVSPQRIEGFMTLEPEICQAMVFGDRKPHLVGLIVPDPDWLKGWAKKHNKKGGLEVLCDDSQLHKALDAAVSRVNKSMSGPERMRRFAVAKEAFTVENSQMTPTMKIRRHIISKEYLEVLQGLY
jgi:long-chain acyl-CoA synthetase